MNSFRIIFFLLVLLIPASLFALEVYPVQRVVLPNGMTIVAKVDKKTKLVGVHTFIGSGWSHDPEGKSGLSALTINCLAQGSKSLSSKDLVKKLGQFAFGIGSQCEREVSYLRSQVLSESLPEILKLHADLIKNPRFDKEVFKDYKTMARKKLRSSKRHPSADTYLPDQLRPLVYGSEHPYAKNRIGDQKSLGNISINDLKSHHKKFYNANAMTISLVGNFELNDVVKQIMDLYSALKVNRERRSRLTVPAPPMAIKKAIEEFRPLKGIKKTHVSLGFQAPSFTNDDFYSMVLLESILCEGRSSVLKRKFADKTNIDDISSSNKWALGTSDFSISFVSDSSDVDSSVAIILEELEKLRRTPVSKAILKRAKRMLKNRYAFLAAGVLFHSYIIGNFEALDEYEFHETGGDMIDAVTTADIQRIADKYLGLDKYALLVLYPEGESPSKCSQITTKVFKNGLTVIVKPCTSDDIVGLTVGIKGGTYVDPKDKEGLSKLFFTTLEKGSSEKMPDGGVRDSIEDLGAVLNGISNQDASALIGMTSTYFLDDMLSLMYELYKEPNLSGDDFKRSKADLLDKLDYIKESPSAHIEDLLYEKIFAKHPFGKPIYGTKKSLRSITSSDLKAFHKKYFVPGNTTVVIVGNVSPQKVLRQIGRNFGKLPKKSVVLDKIADCAGISTSKVSTLPQRGPISSFAFGFVVPNSFDDFGNFSVIGNICGWGKNSLLYKMLEKNGFTVKSLNYNFKLRGPMGVSCFNGELSGGDMKLLPSLVKKLVASISSRKFTQAEIKSTGRKLSTALAIQNESKLIQSVSIFWSHNYANDLLFIHNLCERYKTMNPKDVERVAQKYFKNYELLITERVR